MAAKQTSAFDSMQGLVAAAHELKTPLAIISHLASALEDDSLSTQAQRTVALQRIQMSAERTMRLVQELTTSYRFSEGQMSLKLQPININHVCEDVANEIMPFAVSRGQELCMQLGRSRLVVGDRDLLGSVVFNLLDNALRHNLPGAVVNVSMQRRSETVRVSVHDNGPGLLPSDISKLQQRLGREIQPIVTRSSGSGLGLYIASQLAKAMGGSIGVGRASKGADFHVDLLHSRQLSLL